MKERRDVNTGKIYTPNHHDKTTTISVQRARGRAEGEPSNLIKLEGTNAFEPKPCPHSIIKRMWVMYSIWQHLSPRCGQICKRIALIIYQERVSSQYYSINCRFRSYSRWIKIAKFDAVNDVRQDASRRFGLSDDILAPRLFCNTVLDLSGLETWKKPPG